MSFSRAKSARFNEVKSQTPGPGSYEPKPIAGKTTPAVAFPKGTRFIAKDEPSGPAPGAYDITFCTPSKTAGSDFKIPPSKTKDKRWAARRHDSYISPVSASTQTDCNTPQDDCVKEQQIEVAELKKLIADRDAQMISLTSATSSLEEEIATLRCIHNELKEKCSTAETAKAEAMNEVQISQDKFNDAKAKAEIFQTKVETLQAELDTKNALVEKHTAQIADLNDKHTAQIAGLNDKHTAQIADLNDKHTAQCSSLDSKRVEAETTLARERELLTSTEEALSEAREAISFHKDTIDKLKEDVQLLQKKIEDAERKVLQQNQKLTETFNANKSLEEKFKILQEEQERLTDENEQLVLANHSAEQEVKDIQAAMVKEQKKITDLEKITKEKNNLKTIIKEKAAKIEELLDLNTLLSGKLDDHKQLQKQFQSMETLVDKMAKQHLSEIIAKDEIISKIQSARKCVQIDSDKKIKKLEDDLAQAKLSEEITKTEYTDKIVALQAKLVEVELSQVKADDSKEEAEKYRKLYEDLQEKIAPFKNQLDAFQLEKEALMGQTSNWAAEAQKLSKDYADLLGHQNHKQKIKRLAKLQDENISLKQEVMTLRAVADKNKRLLSQSQDRVRQLEGKKRFDPSKAFQLNSENETKQTSPLKVKHMN